MTKLRILIVDDEPLAREKIRTLLADERDVEIAGEAADGRSALKAIEKLAPDLVFLDVQMPEMDGFAVLEALEPQQMPAVIFVTAYDQYALRAFDINALDYLLKPFDRERFEKALARGRTEAMRRQTGDLTERLMSLLAGIGDRRAGRLVIKSAGRVFFLRTDEIDWIEAAGNYVKIHAGGESYLHRETMSGIEATLDPARFARIHRSTIVNVERIKELQPWFRGDYIVLLRDDTKLTLGRNYRDRLKV